MFKTINPAIRFAYGHTNLTGYTNLTQHGRSSTGHSGCPWSRHDFLNDFCCYLLKIINEKIEIINVIKG